MYEYTITPNNIHIQDSYMVPKKLFKCNLKDILHRTPLDYPIHNRTIESMEMEWASHNFLYDLHLWRSHTKDVDLNYPQKWYTKAVYAVLGRIAWVFIY